MIVGEISRRDVPLVEPDCTLQRAAQILKESDTVVLVVFEQGRMLGSVSERDLAREGCAITCAPANVTISRIMQTDPLLCPVDMRLEKALALMSQHKQHWLLAVDDQGAVAGSISLPEMFELLLEYLPSENRGPEPEYVHRVRGDRFEE